MTTALARRPSALPTVSDATLPATYERARTALETCHRVDECKDWADKAAALASYAKQAEDKALHKFAVRIQARAVRRCGELLQQFQSKGGRPSKTTVGTHGSSQRHAAEKAGLSEHQELQAVRVANVSQPDFDAVVDGDDPPTITALAERGTEKQTRPAGPPGFAEATNVIGLLKTLEEFCVMHPADVVAGAIYEHEVTKVAERIGVIQRWLRLLTAELEKGRCLHR